MSQTIAVSGASGLVGKALSKHLAEQGFQILPLIRKRQDANTQSVFWNPETGEIEAHKLEGVTGVIHLSGENIASGRWTKAKKERIRSSRVESTRVLVRALSKLNARPQFFICASAVGIYGSRGDEVLDETKSAGNGFLADVGTEWEAAAQEITASGVRLVCLRIGIVLSKAGGALGKMYLPFKLGLGGRLGSGKQYMSWIEISDLLRIFDCLIIDSSFAGPVNAVTPSAVTNAEFTKALGKVLRRPTPFPVPAFALRLLFGDMAEQALLSSTRAYPQKLLAKNFRFEFPNLELALKRGLLRNGED